jgi:high-affinity nickel permease
MAFALGIRHGFDLDHLATIDSITRTVKENARLSKFVGFLFSFGHGIVVIVMSLIIGSGIVQARSPLWLESFGHWISVFFLLAFGILTLWNILPNSSILPTNFRGFLFKKLLGEKYNPFLIILIGALFAFSFDTFTQVALFSISVSVMTSLFFTVILGIVFMLGMMTSDGFNGLFVSSLIQFADKKSALISRIFGLFIACFSLMLGLFGLLN